MSEDLETAVKNSLVCFWPNTDLPTATQTATVPLTIKPVSLVPSTRITTPNHVPLAAIPLNNYSRKLLMNTLAEIEALPVLGADLKAGITSELKEIRDRGIPYKQSKWDAIPLNDAQRQAYSRAALQLEKFGLVQRITERHRDRVTHLRLTAMGLRLALRLAGRHADRSDIAEGLRLTNWGRELAMAVHVPQRRKKVDTTKQLGEQTVG